MWKAGIIFFLLVNIGFAQFEPPPPLPDEIRDLVERGFYDKPLLGKFKYHPTPIRDEGLTEEEKEFLYSLPVPAVFCPQPPVPFLRGSNTIPRDVLEFRARQNNPRPLQQLNPLNILGKGLLRR
jgi:hypothetical protein